MNRLVRGILLVIFIGSASLGISLLNAQSTITLQVAAEWNRTHDLIEMAIASMTVANRCLTYAVEHDLNTTIIATAQNTYQEGVDLLSAANASFYTLSSQPTPSNALGNHTIIRQLALNAMNRFKTTIEQLNSLWKDLPVFTAYRSLTDTVRRLEAYLANVVTIVNHTKIAFPHYNYTDIDSKINEVKVHLTWAKQNVTALLLDTAYYEVGHLNRTLNAITEELHDIAAAFDVKKERILRFINGSLTDLKQTFLNLAQEKGQDVTQEEAQITMTIETAKQQLIMGDTEEAFKAVRDAYRLLILYTNQLSTQTLP
jgi:septation ring formation regulator EzrA